MSLRCRCARWTGNQKPGVSGIRPRKGESSPFRLEQVWPAEKQMSRFAERQPARRREATLINCESEGHKRGLSSSVMIPKKRVCTEPSKLRTKSARFALKWSDTQGAAALVTS